MTALELTDTQWSLISNALHTASGTYLQLANTCATAGDDEMSKQFYQQAKDANTLADYIEGEAGV